MIEIIGGPDRDRTDDLFHAMEARSQLRHRPTPIYSGVGVGSTSNGDRSLPQPNAPLPQK
jgi:hypothetical protein